MRLSDSFQPIFINRLLLTEQQVMSTRSEPNYFEKLNNGITLFVKIFKHNKFSNLLIATQYINGEECFVFGYWIPSFLVTIDSRPLNVLRNFAETYGCRIKIANDEGLFIEKSFKRFKGRPRSLYDIIDILENDDIPCESFAFCSETIRDEFTDLEIFYAFSINNNRYYLWLYDIETIEVTPPKGWRNYLAEISKSLDPYGKTKLKILDLTNKQEIEFDEKKNMNSEFEADSGSIIIPRNYEKPIRRIFTVIANLGDKQKIAIKIINKKIGCNFCGSEQVSKEHIFSQWLRDFFPDKELGYSLAFGTQEEQFLQQIDGLKLRKERLYGLVTHQVCINCNTQWMSVLEEKIKILLVTSEGQLKTNIRDLDLNNAKAILLAKWICIKAVLLVAKDDLHFRLPVNVFKLLKDGIIPENFVIEIAEYDTYDFDYLASMGAFNIRGVIKRMNMTEEQASEIAKGFLNVTILLGNLIFRISYLDESKGLKRHAVYMKTSVLYPDNYHLQFTENLEIEAEWKTLDPDIRIKLFHMGLQLDEV